MACNYDPHVTVHDDAVCESARANYDCNGEELVQEDGATWLIRNPRGDECTQIAQIDTAYLIGRALNLFIYICVCAFRVSATNTRICPRGSDSSRRSQSRRAFNTVSTCPHRLCSASTSSSGM